MRGDIHIFPVNDLRPHIEKGLTCWCKPVRSEKEPSKIVHNRMGQPEAEA